MPLDSRSPVVIGVGQITQKPDDLHVALEPLGLMEEAVAAAAADAGAPGLLAKTDLITVVRGAWRYSDPGRLLAQRFGASKTRTALTVDGGNTPQSLLNSLARRIAAGELDVAVAVGAEAIWSRRRQRAAGIERGATEQTGVEPDEVFGTDLQMSSDHERSRGLEMPVTAYPLFDSAVRHRRGETIEAHRDRISQLWHRLNEVAVQNPYAWSRTPLSAAQIRQPGTGNRMVGFPYTKAMNSNWDLDQGAAVIVCSAAAAEAAGVARDRWVFLHAGSDAHDTPLVSNRSSLGASPAIAAAGARTFSLAGVGPDDLAHIDLYSCFPSAVQVAAETLGLGEDRQLTVTGGLTFAGGPLNNYVMHSVATMAGVLREDAGSLGLVTANGGYLTKHALGIYSTEPPAHGFRWEDAQAEADLTPARPFVEQHEGSVRIEAYTVMHGHDGPERATLACLIDDGRRVWGTSTDTDLMVALEAEEHIGRAAQIRPDGRLEVD